MDLQQFNALIDLAMDAMAILFPLAAVYAGSLKKAKGELVALLDHSPVANKALAQMARNLGANRAAKEMERL